jgi:hypothetical protein
MSVATARIADGAWWTNGERVALLDGTWNDRILAADHLIRPGDWQFSLSPLKRARCLTRFGTVH